MTDKKATIVIVDDDPRLLTTLSINFKARGYEVYSASTGAEGLQVVSQHQPDVVILDMGLPDMDGREVLDGIRGWSVKSWVVVYLFSNLGLVSWRWFRGHLGDKG